MLQRLRPCSNRPSQNQQAVCVRVCACVVMGRGGLSSKSKMSLAPFHPPGQTENHMWQGVGRGISGGLHCRRRWGPCRLGEALCSLTVAPFSRPHTQHSRSSCWLAKNSEDSWRSNQLPAALSSASASLSGLASGSLVLLTPHLPVPHLHTH